MSWLKDRWNDLSNVEDSVKSNLSNLDDTRRNNPLLSAMIPFTPENQAMMGVGGALLGGGMALGGALGAGGAAGAAGGTSAGTGAIAGGGGMLGANGLMNLANLGVGLYGANQAGKAADAQANAAYESNANQLAMYNQNRADQMPWMQQGKTRLEQLGGMLDQGGALNQRYQQFQPMTMASFQTDPSYQFRRDEGIRGIENSMAGRSGFGGGNMLKALSRYNSGLASTEYGAANDRYNQNFTTGYNQFNNDQNTTYNRLASLAGIGQTTAANLGAAGQNYANQAGQGLMNAADARAQGYTANANALSGTV